MTVQKSFTFYSGAINEVDWTLTDISGSIVSSASMSMTLYWGRDRVRPDIVPGTVVPNCSAVTLNFAPSSNTYTGQLIFTSNSAPGGGDYVLAVDATLGGSPLDHWERPAVVLNTGK